MPIGGGQLLKRLYHSLPHCRIAKETLGIASGSTEFRKVFKGLVETPYQAAELYFVRIESLIVFLNPPSCAAVAVIDFLPHLHIMVRPGCGVVDVP